MNLLGGKGPSLVHMGRSFILEHLGVLFAGFRGPLSKAWAIRAIQLRWRKLFRVLAIRREKMYLG